jgi:hypothetical protein
LVERVPKTAPFTITGTDAYVVRKSPFPRWKVAAAV